MAREAVILVHGLWLNGLEMALIGRRLSRAGFAVTRFRYRSVADSIDVNADRLARFVATLDAPAVHLVGHSLGGLVILKARQNPGGAVTPGRIVAIGSPFGGSHAARQLARSRIGRWMLGAARPTLTTDHRQWQAPPGSEVGVVAGTRGIGLGRLFPGLPQPSDGTVALAETELDGARDRLHRPLTHTTLLFAPRIARAVCTFLRTGRFAPSPR